MVDRETVDQWLARGGVIKTPPDPVFPIKAEYWGKKQYARKRFHQHTGLSPRERNPNMPKPLVMVRNTDPGGVQRFLAKFKK